MLRFLLAINQVDTQSNIEIRKRWGRYPVLEELCPVLVAKPLNTLYSEGMDKGIPVRHGRAKSG
ncbi:hypothetical protein [Ochrobactrum teleogrylli]|uniref:Transposase n=1 Tax=Ochrobactrum teleogrylli TaxID=2479765 RepID=A0ABD5JUN8_9HYPH